MQQVRRWRPSFHCTLAVSIFVTVVLFASVTAIKFDVNGYETTCFFEDLFDGYKFNKATFPQCTKVIMNKEKLGEVRTIRLCEALQRPESHVQELYINKEPIISEKSISALAAAIPASPSLRVLALNDCGLTDHHVDVIARLGLHQPSQLESLILENNKIGPAGAEVFAKALGPPLLFVSRLHTLQLHGNAIGNDGAAALSRMLISSRVSVKHIDLSQNGIGALGAISLKRAILENKDLAKMGVEGTDILRPFLRGQ